MILVSLIFLSFTGWLNGTPNVSAGQRRAQGEDPEGEGEIRWLAPPPSYSLIQGGLAGTPNNLFSHYVDMELVDETSIVPDSQSLPKYGHVMSEAQLRSFFKVDPAPEGSSP